MAAPRTQAGADPIARVVVDVPHAHLDRAFDYLVPEAMATSALPGVRVRVRFAGRLVDGFVVSRAVASEHGGRLAFLERVVSTQPILDERSLAFFRAVADRWVGTLSDVIRLAIPPRHAAAEKLAPIFGADPGPLPEPPSEVWCSYTNGTAFVQALAEGGSPRAVWSARPGPSWPDEIAVAVAACVASGRGAVIVVPDLRLIERVDGALESALGPGRHLILHADLGPQERYRRWLAVRRGEVPVVVGTRSAAYAPVARAGLVVCWDDGNDLHDEPRAPYPNTRDVLLLRAHLEGCGALVGGHAPSVEAVALLGSGWARVLRPPRETVRATSPRIRAVGEDRDLAHDAAARAARIPTTAWRAAQTALQRDTPVLVQVARGGYQPGLSCERCRRPARCTVCGGPLLRTSSDTTPACGWCGALAPTFFCQGCRGTVVRTVTSGSLRTAEELGRAFPQVPVRVSGGGGTLTRVPAQRMLVVATPGAEPVADGGYGAALLLDTQSALGRPDLRAAEETLRRWLGAAALVQSGVSGGEVVVVADGGLPVVQALLRWDPVAFAEREASDRSALSFPPAVRMAALEGDPDAIHDAVTVLSLPSGADLLGPVMVADSGGEPVERVILRINRSRSAELSTSLRALAALRSARKSPGKLRIRLDPRDAL